LAVYIRKIRKALGDDPRKPEFIETMHRLGYRFVAPITTVAQSGSSQAPADREASMRPIIREAATTIGSRPLVGRKRELAFLQERLEATLQGKGSVLFITGPAGIGKTRLVRELQDHAAHKGCQWLEGKYNKAGSQPYRAWADVARSYLQQGDAASHVAGPYAVHLAKIVPEMAGGSEDTRATVRGDPESERLRLFEGLTQFFIHISHQASLVLFLDDLQWAPSIELLHYLARNIGNQRVLVLGAFRDDELKTNETLWGKVLAMNRERLFQPLPLEPLEQREVAQLMSCTLEETITPQLVDVIYHRTEGNPFFVEEVLRLLRERKAIIHTEAGWNLRDPALFETPESVKAVVNERIESLGKDAVELLRMASVIGREFPLHLLREFMGQEEEGLIQVMDRCEAAGLIRPQRAPGEEVYSFTHDLMQEALYENIGSARRRRHHLRIGHAMERLYAARLADRYDVLAHHFFEGNNLEKAAEYGEHAARRAIGVHAYGKAVRLLEQVLEAQAVVNPDDRAKRCDLLLTLGSALGPAGEPKRVADVVAPEALEIAEQIDDRQWASLCCQMALEGMVRYGGPPITYSPTWREWAERASRYADPGTNQQVIADLALARVYRAQRRWEEWRRLTVRAGELARKLKEPEVLFKAMTLMIAATHGVQHDPERLRLAEEFIGVPKAGVSASTLSFFLRRSQAILLAAGERDRAEEVWRELDQLVSHTHDANVLLWPLLAETLRANLDGNLEHAAEARTRISKRADELGTSPTGRLMGQHLSFQALLHLGRGEEALADLPEVERLVGSQAFSSTARFGWGALCLAHMGRLAEAKTQLSEYLGQLKLSPEEDDTPAPMMTTLLETAVLVEDREAASLLAKRLTGVVAYAVSYVSIVNVARNLGKASALLEDRRKARANYERALDWATKIRFRPEVALTRFELAKLLLFEAKDASTDQATTLRSEAQAHLDFAISEFEAMKMQPALERALRHKREGQS
jgi:tetratricopeptide (TPR) repeat protein